MADISKVNLFGTQYNIADIEARKRVSESLLKDTVGWVGKNKLKIASSVVSSSTNGITFTVKRNALGELVEVDANGTASANTTFSLGHYIFPSGDYIFSGCPANGSSSSYRINISTLNGSSETGLGYDYGEGFNFTLSEDTDLLSYLRIASGAVLNHVKFYPMLRDASIADDTYEPYHESVEQCKFDRAEQRVLGAKNFCESRCPTSTINGITYTKNSDGSYTISGVNDNTNSSSIRIDQSSPVGADNLKSYNGNYTLSLLDAEGNHVHNTNLYLMQVDTWAILLQAKNENNGVVSGNINIDNSFLYISVPKGSDFTTPVTVYPMLRLASDPDDTYAPFAMTNRELTDVSNGRYVQFKNETVGEMYDYIKKYGFVVFCAYGEATKKLTNNEQSGYATGFACFSVGLNAPEYYIGVMGAPAIYIGRLNTSAVGTLKKVGLNSVI